MQTERPTSASRHDIAPQGNGAMPEPRKPDHFPRKDVGALLARERAAAGLTQAQVALRAGITQAAVSRIETSSSLPSMLSLQRLAHALGLQLTLVLRRGDQTICELSSSGSAPS